MSDILFREHTDAVIAALEAQLTVGDAVAPKGAGRQEDGDFSKYVVVYRITGGNRSGNLDDPDGDGEFIYQVTCVGESRQQAEWLVDKAEELLANVALEDRDVTVRPHSNPGVLRDDTVTPPIFYATPRFRLKTTPA